MILSLLLLLQTSIPMIEENSVQEPVIELIPIPSSIPLSPSPEPASMKLSVSAGGVISLGSQDSYSLAPTAIVEVEAKLAATKYAPRLNVIVSLSSLPGQSLNINDPSTFRSVEFESGIQQGIPSVYPKIYAGFGLATRLPGDTKPRVNAAKYFTAGVLFTTKSHDSYLYVGGGPDQRLSNSYLYQATAHIEGKVKLATVGGVKSFLVGNAILGSVSSLVRVGITVGM